MTMTSRTINIDNINDVCESEFQLLRAWSGLSGFTLQTLRCLSRTNSNRAASGGPPCGHRHFNRGTGIRAQYAHNANPHLPDMYCEDVKYIVKCPLMPWTV